MYFVGWCCCWCAKDVGVCGPFFFVVHTKILSIDCGGAYTALKRCVSAKFTYKFVEE